MLSQTAEDYIKAIYEIGEQSGQDQANLGLIAKRVGVTSGTATTMLKRFEREGLLSYELRKGACLTEVGTQKAERLVMKHRLIECFLVTTLGMDWSEVHEEAERLEHAISDALLEKLDHFLARPTIDPHGHSIPRNIIDSKAKTALCDLWESKLNTTLTVAWVTEETHFLKYLNELGLSLGSEVMVTSQNQVSSLATVTIAGRELTMSRDSAVKIKTREVT